MSPTRLPGLAAAAVLVTALVAPAAPADTRAALRVATPERQLLQVDAAGAARSFRDVDGLTYPLPQNRVLGQLVTGTSLFGRHLGVQQTPNGPFVSSIAGVSPGAKGFWALFVNNRFATVGARDYVLRRGDEVVWVLDPDYTRPGPSFLDLDLLRVRAGTATFRVTRVAPGAGGYAARAARGAVLTVAGRGVRVGPTGSVRVALRPGAPFAARATARGTIPSELVRGVG